MTEPGAGWEHATSRRSVSLGVALAIGVVALLTGFGIARLAAFPDAPTGEPSDPPSLVTATDPPSEVPVPTVVVPVVEGLTMAEASRVLSSVGLIPVLDEFEEDTDQLTIVVAQTPAGGSHAPRGSNVGLRSEQGQDAQVEPSGS